MSEHTPFQKQRRRVAFALAGLIPTFFLPSACSSIAPSLGDLPSGGRLARIKQSPNYIGGEFKYPIQTEMWTGGGSIDYLKQSITSESKNISPITPLPVVLTNIANIDIHQDVAIWLGHSTTYLQVHGKRILIDPVFSSHTSPMTCVSKAFVGHYPYSADQMPTLDYVIISHDHWDHLDYPTITQLRSKVKAIVTPLGVGSYLESWGYTKNVIYECDWHEKIAIEPGISIHILPARHFSGRAISENKTLWAAFLITTPHYKIFYSGDGGYGPHFSEIADRFGAVDVALMENGQYDSHWAHMHMMPEEVVQAALDLKTKMVIPVHAGRFALANHAWDDPFKRIYTASKDKNFILATPLMGEIVELSSSKQTFSQWWIR